MEIGVGLPTYVRGLTLEQMLEWASLRLPCWTSREPLVALSMAAAVTVHIRLMTAILTMPYRRTAVLAKPTPAQVDLLGVAVGYTPRGRATQMPAKMSATGRRKPPTMGSRVSTASSRQMVNESSPLR